MSQNKKDTFNFDDRYGNDDCFNRHDDDRPLSPPPLSAKVNIMNAIDFGGKNAPTFGSIFNAYFRRIGIPAVSCLLLLTVSLLNYETKTAKQPLNTSRGGSDAVFIALSTSIGGIKYYPVTSSIAERQQISNKHSDDIYASSKNNDAVTTETLFDRIATDIGSINRNMFPEIIPQNEPDNLNNYIIAEANTSLLKRTRTDAESYSFTDKPVLPDISTAQRIRLNSMTTPITLSLRGISVSDNSIGGKQVINSVNSFSAGIYTQMSLTSDLKIGIECGREPFTKKYFDKQNPKAEIGEKSINSFWGAVGITYSYSGRNGNGVGVGFKPTATLLLGAGEIGPTVRTSIGLTHEVSENISAYVGMEASAMFYNNRYSWFASKNFGITAGINYNIK